MFGLVFVSLVFTLAIPFASAGEIVMGGKVSVDKHASWSTATAVEGGAYGDEVGVSWSEESGHGAAFAIGQIIERDHYTVPNPGGEDLEQPYVQAISHDTAIDTKQYEKFGKTDHKWRVNFNKRDDLDPVEKEQHNDYLYHIEEGHAHFKHYTRDWEIIGGDYELEARHTQDFTLQYQVHLVGSLL